MICDRVDDSLTEVLDGTADPVLLNHAATCPRCRGLMADLRQVEDIVRAAGSDALGRADPASAAKASLRARRGRPSWRAGVGALAAAALAGVIGGVAWTHRGPVDGAWRGTVEARVGSGLTVCDPSCAPAGVGTAIGPGARLETDAFTRASIRLDDGSTLLVDRGSAIALDPRRIRAARVAAGRVLADVAHVDGSRASLVLPDGEVTVLGTQLVVGTLGQLGEVTVTRGAVSVRGDRGEARVAAGETATLEAGRAPAVAQRTDWEGLPTLSELPEDTVRGIGELRARKPGATDEQASALRLARHHAKIRASGPVAVTEIEEVFANDGDDVLEGIFRFPLPVDASIESLALEVDGELIQGAFVPRARAKQIWTDVTTAKPQVRDDGILWYKDPALLEWQRGGRFELRIFPIPAHGSRRVVVRYSQIAAAVGDTRRMQVPLPSGGQPIDDFALDVAVVGNDPALGLQTSGYRFDGDDGGVFSAERFAPAGDLVLAWALAERGAATSSWAYAEPSPAPLPAGAPASLDPRDPFVAIAVHPSLPGGPSRRPDVVLVVDRSRSMVGERLGRARALAAEIAARLDEEQRARVLACDVTCDEMPGEPLSGGDHARVAVAAFLDGQSADGGSDALAALSRAMDAGRALGRPFDVVWIGDGAPTLGPTRPATLEAAIADRAAGARVFPVPIGADADTEAMAAVARASGGAVVPYVPGQRLDAAALTVVSATWSGVLGSITVTAPSGVVAVVPPGRPVRAGEEVLVYGRLRPGVSAVDGELVLSGTLDGAAWTRSVPLRVRATDHAGNAFVPRAYAAAAIARLEARGDAADQAEIEAWSTQYRVASRSTSLLVLESAAMFDAYGLARTSVAPAFDGEVAATAEDAQDGAGDAADAQSLGGLGTLGYGAGAAGRSAGVDSMLMQLGYVEIGGGTIASPPSATSGTRAPRDRRWDDPTWIPYKEVWIRHASVRPPGFREDAPAEAVAAARAAYVARGGRDEGRRLVEALLVAGAFAEAGSIAETALAADPLDADLLRVRSDAAALQGDRAAAVRLLSGVADARPDAGWLFGWLQSGYAATGAAALACDAAIARAELDPDDGQGRGAALGCADALGWHATTAALRAGYAGDVAAVEAAVAAASSPDVLSADVWLHAAWAGDEDLDISLIGPTGRRYGWLGPREGDGRAKVRGPVSVGDEAVSFAGLKRGAYRIQVSRVGAGGAGRPIDGTLEVALPGGEVTRVPFHLDADTTLAGWLDVRFTRETVILRGWSPFRWTDRGGWFP